MKFNRYKELPPPNLSKYRIGFMLKRTSRPSKMLNGPPTADGRGGPGYDVMGLRANGSSVSTSDILAAYTARSILQIFYFCAY